jgi:hypothetical protein
LAVPGTEGKWTPYFEGKATAHGTKSDRTSRENSTVPEGKTYRTSRERTVLEEKFHRSPREGIPYLKGTMTVLRGKENDINSVFINMLAIATVF